MLRRIFNKTPIAFRQLMKEKNCFGIAVAGIAFANILIFSQMGFEASLFDSSTAPHKSLNADLVVVNRYFESIEAIWYLFLKYKGFRKADLRSPATIRVQENEKS